MKIGITYDLKDEYLREGFSDEEAAEFDRIDTIEGIEQALWRLGFVTDRIGHARSLVQRLAAGDRWELVFNIAEGMYGIGREAQVPAILDVYNIPYVFSDTVVLGLTLHKGLAKHVVRDSGLATPDFMVVEQLSDLDRLNLSFPLFAKPVAEGTGKGIDAASRVCNPADLRAVCGRLLTKFQQPVLVEAYLPGREFTTGILGTGSEARALGSMEVVLGEKAQAHAYTYDNKAHYEGRVDYRLINGALAEACAELAVGAWRVLGCRDGGRIDIRCDAAGKPFFLEVNPLAGINPVHSDLPILSRLAGFDYDYIIREIMRSALKRVQGSAVVVSPAMAA